MEAFVPNSVVSEVPLDIFKHRSDIYYHNHFIQVSPFVPAANKNNKHS